MLFQIFKYEISYWLKKPVIYFYFLAFFGFTFLSFIGEGGYFLETIPSSPYQEILNSPSSIATIFQYMGKLLLFLLPAIIGVSIYKDFKYRAHHIMYTFPIRKSVFLLAKFFSAFAIVIFISSSSGLAMIVGEYVLGVGNPKIEPFSALSYFYSYAVFVIPNLFFFGVLVFAIVALTRNIYSGFVTVVLLFFAQLITENALSDPYFIALSDPFGQNSLSYTIRDWDLFQRNSLPLQFWGVILYNRLLFLGATIVLVVGLYKLFSFSQLGLQVNLFRKTSQQKALSKPTVRVTRALSEVSFSFNLTQQLKTTWHLSMLNFKHCITSPMFYVFSILGLFTTIIMLYKISQLGELAMQPLTKIMLSIPAYFFVSIIIIITFIYSGMLVHRDGTAKMDGLINSTAVSNSVLLWSKIIGLIKVQYLLLTLLMLSGIIVQLSLGYYNIDLPQYCMNLYVVTGITLIVWALVSVFLHSLLSNVYLGMFLLLFLWILKASVTHLGIDTQLLQFNTPPDLSYSDMYGYGAELLGYFVIESYWLSICLLLILLSFLLWRRQKPFSAAERIAIARKRFNRKNQFLAMGLILLAFGLGFTIYLAENEIESDRTSSKSLEEFTQKFERFSGFNQPRIQSINMQLDIYPNQRKFNAKGHYELLNTTQSPIDTILIKTGFDEISSVKLERKNVLVDSNKNMRFLVYKLVEPLAPQERLGLDFVVESVDNSLFQINSNVVKNGTFIKSDILPRVGYYVPAAKKHPNDTTALNNHYQSIDSDLLDFECIISTSKNQTAIATGKLHAHWEEENRSYYLYKTESPIKMGMAFNSGDFEIINDQWNETEIQLYSLKSHSENADRMLAGMKAALEYNEHHFGKPLLSNLNIVEFPSTQGSFATAFGNALLVSETRFGVKPEEGKIDLAFYVAAHEMTHHWFGNQLLPKDVLGAAMLTESITEYITLNIYRHAVGEKAALQFLKKQRERYFRGKWRREKENPLYLASVEEDYLTYGKGCMALNTLSYYWGEENLLRAIKSFMQMHPAVSCNYPTSLEFVNHLKAQVPDSLEYLIRDRMEAVRSFDASIDTVEIHKMDGEFVLDIHVTCDKKNEAYEPISPKEDMEIGVYNEQGVLLNLSSIKVKGTNGVFRIAVKDKPAKVELDPKLLMIDDDINNNNYTFSNL